MASEPMGKAEVDRVGGRDSMQIDKCVAFQSSEGRRPSKPSAGSGLVHILASRDVLRNSHSSAQRQGKPEPEDSLAVSAGQPPTPALLATPQTTCLAAQALLAPSVHVLNSKRTCKSNHSEVGPHTGQKGRHQRI